jgi:hypothetical protein
LFLVKTSVHLLSELPDGSLNKRYNALITRDVRVVEAEKRRESHLHKSLTPHTIIDITTIDITIIDITTMA